MKWNWNWNVKLFGGTSVDLFYNTQSPLQSERLPVCHTDIYTLDGHDPEGTYSRREQNKTKKTMHYGFGCLIPHRVTLVRFLLPQKHSHR